MGLFTQLQHLYRKEKFQLEDFHTEIVAQVLRNNPKLAIAWLNGIGATMMRDPVAIYISTQEEFARLTHHLTDSRPDIAIRFITNGASELILIESKVGAAQGPDQLQRYADHLRAAEAIEKTTLIFITRNYESVDANLGSDLRFISTRWFQFYHYLKAHVNGDGLARELKLFMEENGMSLGNQFRAIDIVAMENFSKAWALMDETLEGEVSAAAEAILGRVTSTRKALPQYRDYGRYIIYTEFGNLDFWCQIGYWFSDSPDEPLWVGIVLESSPKSPIRKDVIKSFRALVEKSKGEWVPDSLDDPKAWSALSRGQSLQKFLAEKDHVRAVKDHFLKVLQEVKEFRAAKPNLPWATGGTEETPE